MSKSYFHNFFSRIFLNYISYFILSFGITASLFYIISIDMAVTGGVLTSWIKAIAPANEYDGFSGMGINIYAIYVFFAFLVYPMVELIKKIMIFLGKEIPEIPFKKKVLYSFVTMFVLSLLGSIATYTGLEPSQQKHVFPLILIAVIMFIFAFTSVYMFLIFRNYIRLRQEKESTQK